MENSTMTFLERLERSVTPADVIEIELKNAIVRMLIVEREIRGLSQKAFAKLIGVEQSTISRWENGELNITIKTLSKACAGLGLTPVLKLVKEATRSLNGLIKEEET